ncbi:golgin-84 [Anopheles nili]|uniref:golgin-84 n=1 Tax=Anopheles nili TaxID=185578 RepID=UPI00237B6D48|nr:golgin-84 [Anopheles nili]
MSWFQDLAGRAENILTKIDQNAATVLQTRPESGDVEDVSLLEVSVTNEASSLIPTKSRHIPKASALNIKSSRGMVRSASNSSYEKNNEVEIETQSSKSEKQNFSATSSRRSSLNSKKDGTVIDMRGVEQTLSNPESHDLPTGFVSIEKELEATKIILAEIKSERDELKSELDNTISQLSDNDTERKLIEVGELCQKLSEEKNNLAVRVQNIEEANGKYVKSISELESTIAKHIQSEQELSSKLEMAKMETENACMELQQFRVRAHATLQLKEKTIEQLKEQINCGVGIGTTNTALEKISNSEQILQIELEQVRQEKNNLLEELGNFNERMKFREAQWMNSEEKLRVTIQGLEQCVARLQQQITLETDKLSLLEDDFKNKQNELVIAREDLIKQRTSFSLRLHEKESENNKLRNKIQTGPVSPLSDHEDRLASLTQSLVQKQTALETVTAERNALRIQLEKLENQYRSTASQVRQQRAVYLSSNVTDDAKSQVPNFMLETPFDNHVARRMKRAYSSLDSIGIRLGVFLRRYPLIRILVIVYVALLHLWVMFVLLSSTPT